MLATVKKVEELDCKSEIIRYKKKITPTFIVQTIPRLFNISFVKSKLSGNQKDNALKSKPFYQAQVQQRNQRFDAFVDKYFAPLFSESYGGWETLVAKCKKNYDAFLCGSDQLWLPNNLGSHFYTLEFAPDNKTKVAYATSFGVSQIPNSQKKATAKYLNRFQHLSTRELAGQKIIKELTGKTAQVVCDPTLLFDAEGWKQMLPEKKVVEEPYVFCYFLGTNEEHRRIANEFKNKTGLKLATCPFLDNYVECDLNFGDIQLFDIDAADFVNLIRHAEYILTDSFHGSVFSILNHKKFMTFNRFNAGANSRNSRIDTPKENSFITQSKYGIRDRIETMREFANPKSFKGFAWNKLYKLDLIEQNNLRYDMNCILVEDALFNHQYMSCCMQSYYVDCPLYHYITRSDSLTNQSFKEKNWKLLESYRNIIKFCGLQKDKELDVLLNENYLNHEITILKKMKFSKTPVDREKMQWLKEKVKSEIRSIWCAHNISLKRKLMAIYLSF